MAFFKSLELRNWRQFDLVQIEFHPRLTILTGANGAGKTTILHLLNRHWGWNIPYVSTPRFSKQGIREYWTGFWSTVQPRDWGDADAPIWIGTVECVGRDPSRLTLPKGNTSGTFEVGINPQWQVPGVYVPSHRPLYVHSEVGQIPTRVDARQQLFDVYLGEMRKRWQSNQRVSSVSHTLKQSLISLATFGYGNTAVEPNDDARQTFEGFQRVLAIVLPETLGFRGIRVRVPDVILETDTGEFAFDAVSGGVSALIDIAWQVFLYSTLHESFVVVIDEPEAHLHPKLQRSVLPSLLEAFPQAQFVVATHNPFVVTSTKDSSVYVLSYDSDRRVSSQLLDQANKAGTANEVLREVLGLESTTPLWVDGKLKDVINRFRARPLSHEMLRELRQELDTIGLGKYLPETLGELDS